jgi:hypothetical protein
MKKASSIIIQCLKEKGLSQAKIAEMMGEDPRKINQQLHRYNDMMAERLFYILEHAGYKVEFIDNNIKRVCSKYAEKIFETGKPKGRFYVLKFGVYFAINNSIEKLEVEKFSSYEDCIKYLSK